MSCAILGKDFYFGAPNSFDHVFNHYNFQHEISYQHEEHVKGLSTLIGMTQSQV
jgi:hypothetical protein